jgi:hypothetical protein
MFDNLKKWWQKRGTSSPIMREIDWPTAKKVAPPRKRPKELDTPMGRRLWRSAAQVVGAMKYRAHIEANAKSKLEKRQAQAAVDHARERLFWSRVEFVREQRAA